ncbi:serine/threonine-protein kinase [Nocardia arthritidis]|uniref:non-specific serine/threonine protein kinase n=1 Tax=Nocardia arthritidis TaxID=228602 RepID=A0A6G9YNK2_9NOCA|nr:serine/threonine-protein kinase [Nocardia arthritidis]QIS14657.1 protein kinase [Nocardia arthritidis]
MGLRPGTVFAGFAIERLLGVGGMGSVYLATHPRLRRRVALKVLADAFTGDPKTRTAFDREATLAAGLDHPNIVPVYDRSAADDPALWLAMRYIDGGDVAGLLSAHPDGLAPERALRLLEDAAHALDYAHAQGVLHRDVKPANLLVEHDRRGGERAVLTDFGIARTLDDTVTLSGIAATFAYVAPERFTDAPADHRADVYSLGCTLFQLLTGRQPFPRKEQAAVIAAHLSAPPPAPSESRPELPAELDAVLATALAKSPEDRYASCTAFAEAAANALRPAAVTVRAEPPRPVLVSGNAVPDQAVIPTVIRAVAPAPPIPFKQPRWVEPVTRGKPRRMRFVVASGLLLAGVGVAVGAAFVMRDDGGSSNPGTTSKVVPQPVTTTTTSSAPTTSQPPPAPPTEAPNPADIPPITTAPPQPPPRRSTTVPQQAPAPQPGPVVPQTRSYQWPE